MSAVIWVLIPVVPVVISVEIPVLYKVLNISYTIMCIWAGMIFKKSICFYGLALFFHGSIMKYMAVVVPTVC